MARIRTVKPEFFTSLTIASLPYEARLTFIGLWTHVDDEGRCVDEARLVKAAIWPLDDRTAADIQKDLDQLTECSLITQYEVDNRRYIAIRGWWEHQKINRPTRSKLPAPPTSGNGGATVPSSAATSEYMESPNPDESSVNPHGALTEDSLPEGNREQGTGKPPAVRREAPNGLPGDQQALVDMPANPTKLKREPTPDDQAFGVARWWINEREERGIPIVVSGRNGPLHTLKNLFTPFIAGAYTEDELKKALAAMNAGVPSKQQLERALVDHRTGVVASNRQGRSGDRSNSRRLQGSHQLDYAKEF